MAETKSAPQTGMASLETIPEVFLQQLGQITKTSGTIARTKHNKNAYSGH
jgi:hypothetical protein